MCGILGIISKDNKDFSTIIKNSCELMHHRGPDDTEFFEDKNVNFGFKRLAILDLEKSVQPLEWGPEEEPKRYLLIFNGEIYNYLELRTELKNKFNVRFNTSGDSEVIPAAYHYYGKNLLDKLRGMFAFSIWDKKTKTLFLARDQFGIKPLYYENTDSNIMFSSERKALSNIKKLKNVNTKSVQKYFEFQYIPENNTIFENIKKLPSGHYLEYNLKTSNCKITRYFYPNFNKKSNLTKQDIYNSIAEKLVDSVKIHMRSDVTVGSFLSGGIDSTAIAAIAKEVNPKIVAFTTGFNEQQYSEIDTAIKTAKELNIKHEINLVSMNDFMEYLPQIVWYLDDPVADPALVPLFFVAKNARKHAKVVLSGEGADELFGGYTIYKEPQSLKYINNLPRIIKKPLNNLVNFFPDGIKGKSFVQRGSMDLEQRYYGNARTFKQLELNKLLKSYNPKFGHTDTTKNIYKESINWNPISRMQHIDIFTWLNGDILVKADKMTMANSLELRVPFLDKEVLSIAEEIPDNLKISQGTTKYALRMALKQIVPEHILNIPKLGFPVPIRVWLKDNEIFYNWAKKIIKYEKLSQWLNLDYALDLLEAHKLGKVDNSRKIWNIIIFSLWIQIFVTEDLKPKIDKKPYPIKK